MAKFDAGVVVEPLEYDFTAYGGGSGVIVEPTTGAVNEFFRGMRSLLNEVSALQADLEKVDGEDDEAMIAAASKVSEAQEGALQYQNRTVELIAELCGNSPSVEDLQRLPYRVLQAFTPWLMEQIRPKRTTPGSKR